MNNEAVNDASSVGVGVAILLTFQGLFWGGVGLWLGWLVWG